MLTFVNKHKKLLLVSSTVIVLVISAFYAIREAGVWLLVKDPLPDKVDIVFTFAGERYRVDYSSELMMKYPDAHWVLSDFKDGYYHYIKKRNFDISRVTVIDTCASTIFEVKSLFSYLEEHRNLYPNGITAGLVSGPYHMRRIQLMVKSRSRLNNVKFVYLPVPLESYNTSNEMYERWWNYRNISSVVFSELPKIIYFYLFDNK
ncbi:MAG TPA: hypothetical protein VHO70_17465 [Chitinispirillaceae bacterium]|nr:hypothetical protein [Chitinispirillaceae bacterium]